jgi:DNA-binding transcriptional LysR family regulator
MDPTDTPSPSSQRVPLGSQGIELRHLRYFLAVFDELHFGRAAETLHMAQPPLSQATRKLEENLGVQLLERTSRVVTPTEAGRVFAENARRVLASLDLAVAAAQRAGALETDLRIGCVHDLPLERLLRFLAALKEHDPAVEPRVTHLPSVEQVRRLRRGELDLGVFHGAVEHTDIEMEPLFAGEPMVALLPSGHPLAAKQVLGPSDLRDEVVVSFSRDANPPLHDRMLAAIDNAGYRFRGVYEAAGADARDLLPAVAQSMGVAFAPSSLPNAGEDGAGVARRLLDPAPSMPETVVAWHANPQRWPNAVLDNIRVVARKLANCSDIDQARIGIGRSDGSDR